MPKSKKIYKCELCGMTTYKKDDYNKHKARNTSCISNDDVHDAFIGGDNTRIAKDSVKQLLSRMLDILRDNESLIGGKALMNLHKLLTLRMIKPLVIGENPKIKLVCGKYGTISGEYRGILESCVNFDKLAETTNDILFETIKDLRYYVLKDAVCFGDMFSEQFEIKYTDTYRKLIDLLRVFPFENIGHDIFGDVYEQILSTTMTGRDFAQFLTPSTLRDFMVKLVDPQLNRDGTFETIFDPTMGTAGFLISSYRYLQNKAKENGIEIDENFLANFGLNGCEIVPDTYGLAQSNILINTGTISYNCVRQDSIRSPIKGQYDIVLANPPFGVKGLNYEGISFDQNLVGFNKYDYIPIRSSKASVIVLQICIHLLKIGGRCAIVMPYSGQETNSTGDFAKIREYLLRSCEVHAVINNVSKDGGKIFEYASPNTCVIYFTKRAEPFVYIDIDGVKQYDIKNCVLIPQYRQQRKKNTPPSFLGFVPNPNICFTKEVKFQTLNIYTKTGHSEINEEETLTVPIDEILQKGCVFSPIKYRKPVIKICTENIAMVRLGDLIDFRKKSTRKSEEKQISGKYRFYNSGMTENYYCDVADYTEETVIIGDGGMSSIYIDHEFSCTDHNYLIYSVNPDVVTNKYIYAYLQSNFAKLAESMTGSVIKNLHKDNLTELTIPVPSIGLQQKIIDRLELIAKTIEDIKKLIESLKLQNTNKINGETDSDYCSSIKLGDLIEMENGTFNTSEKTDNGTIPFYNCSIDGKIGTHHIESFDYPEYIMLIRAGGSKDNPTSDSTGMGKVFYIIGKAAAHKGICALIPKKDIINVKYLYHFLDLNKRNIANIATYFTGIGKIKTEDILNLSIPMPSLEIQQQIVEYCDANNKLIEQLEKNIEIQQNETKNVMTNMLNVRSTKTEIPQYQQYVIAWMQKNNYDINVCISDPSMMPAFTYTASDEIIYDYRPYVYEQEKYAIFIYENADDFTNNNLINLVMSATPNTHKLVLLIDNDTVVNAVDNAQNPS